MAEVKHENIDNELAGRIIDIIGPERIKEVYELLGAQKVSFATLNKVIVYQEINKSLSENISIKEIAKEKNINASTVYRIFNKKIFNLK